MKNLVLRKTKSIWEACGMPIIIFSTSRIIIYFIVLLVFAHSFGEVRMDRWDAQHYLSIAENGYQFHGEYKNEGALIAFFPFYPFIIKIINFTFGLSFINSALLASFFFGLGSAILLFNLVSEWKGKEAALTAISLFSFYPFSVFLSAPYTESLFMFLTLLTFYLLRREITLGATLSVSLVCFTRITGGIIGLIFVWQVWKQTKSLVKTFGYSFLAGIPCFIFLYFQYVNYGTPFAFLLAQKINWNHYFIFPWLGLFNFFKTVMTDVNFAGMWRADAMALSVMIITLLVSLKKIPKDIWLFGFGVLILTLSQSFILGMGRYLTLILPFYFYWGWFLSNRPLAKQLVLIVSASWMVFNTILFILSKNIF